MTEDENWLTVGALADIVFDAVQSGLDALVSLPRDATDEERRDAMRAEFDKRRGDQAARQLQQEQEAARPPTWRERLWGREAPRS